MNNQKLYSSFLEWRMLLFPLVIISTQLLLITRSDDYLDRLGRNLPWRSPSTTVISDWETEAKAITVRVITNNHWGSGVLSGRNGNTYTVVTSAHLLNDSNQPYQIETPDGQIYSTTIIPLPFHLANYDLALLSFESSNPSYTLAKWGKTPSPGESVLAAGFPYSLLKPEEKNLILTKGMVWNLLDKSLEGGYQLGYSNDIYKGMSGGPLLNQAGEVVAINGMHAHPLLGNPYTYQDGKIPDYKLVETMKKYSFGIPIPAIKNLITNIKK